MSEQLGTPYIYVDGKFVCRNGVMFTLEEYRNGIDIRTEYKRRTEKGELYDYDYAKATGIVRKKEAGKGSEEKGAVKAEAGSGEAAGVLRAEHTLPDTEQQAEMDRSGNPDDPYGGNRPRKDGLQQNGKDETEEAGGAEVGAGVPRQGIGGTWLIVVMLALTSLVSMYISTLHTATYLRDYADVISAWLMSAGVTAYNATAFEVSVLFHKDRRNFMAVIFMLLWMLVTVFSMATTVSVFYDSFNAREREIAGDNSYALSSADRKDILRKKEADLRSEIAFKEKDISYRQEHEYATTEVRKELNALQEKLRENLAEQEKLISEGTGKPVSVHRESLFAFLGRLLKMDGGVLEFIMSVLSAVFVNLISPLSATAMIELSGKKRLTK
jgi:hypothetical protein